MNSNSSSTAFAIQAVAVLVFTASLCALPLSDAQIAYQGLLAMGSNVYGQLGAGDGSVPVHRDTPTLVGAALSTNQLTGVSIGRRHTLALSSLGDVYSWGNGERGQLGTISGPSGWGSNLCVTPRLVNRVATFSDAVSAVVSSMYSSFAITTPGGKLWAWGANEKAQLGQGYVIDISLRTDRTTPTFVGWGLSSVSVVDIRSASGKFLLARDDSGHLYSCRGTATLVTGALSSNSVIGVSSRNLVIAAVVSSGRVYAWDGYSYQLGQGHGEPSGPARGPKMTTPLLISHAFSTTSIVQVAQDTSAGFGRTSSGSLYAWGAGHYAMFGLGYVESDGSGPPSHQSVRHTPTLIRHALSTQSVVLVVEGGDSQYAMALTDNGDVFTWGNDKYTGRLGLGVLDAVHSTPTLLTGALSTVSITQLSSSASHIVALSATASIYHWGYLPGFLKIQRPSDHASYLGSFVTPTLVTTLGHFSSLTITAVEGILNFLLMRASNGRAYTWGTPNAGLGVGAVYSSNHLDLYPTPTLVKGDLASAVVSQISVGDAASSSTVAYAVSSGRVYSWGHDAPNTGALVLDQAAALKLDRGTASMVTGAFSTLSITSVAAGVSFGVAVASNGRVYGWGENSLSNGNPALAFPATFEAGTPTLIPGDVAFAAQSFVAVYSSDRATFTIGLTSGRRLYTWGYGQQFRRNPIAGDEQPVLIGGALSTLSVASVAVSQRHVMVCTTTGLVYTLGGHFHNPLGFGREIVLDADSISGHKTVTPTLVRYALSSVSIAEVAASIGASYAVGRGGAVYGWGHRALTGSVYNGYRGAEHDFCDPASRTTPALIVTGAMSVIGTSEAYVNDPLGKTLIAASGSWQVSQGSLGPAVADLNAIMFYVVADGEAACTNVALDPAVYHDQGPVTVKYPTNVNGPHAHVPPCFLYVDGIKVNVTSWGQTIATFSTPGTTHTIRTVTTRAQSYTSLHVYTITDGGQAATIVEDPSLSMGIPRCRGGPAPVSSPYLMPASYAGPGPVTVTYVASIGLDYIDDLAYRQVNCTVLIDNKHVKHINLTKPGLQHVATFDSPGSYIVSYCVGTGCQTTNGNPTQGQYVIESPCPAGQYSETSSISVCHDCPTGRYSVNRGGFGLDACLACSPGTYSNVTGVSDSALCLGCRPGTFAALCSGASACLDCAPGTYNSNFSTPCSASDLACRPCPRGAYSSSAASSQCEQCREGTYGAIESQSVCVSCAAGKYAISQGVTLSADNGACTNCPAGTYSSHHGASAVSFCSACPGSSSSPAGSTDINMCLCDAGYGGVSSATCSLCVAGTYKATSGFNDCTLCARGKWSGAVGAMTSATCTDCVAGRYNIQLGSSSSLSCEPCPAATYSANVGASTGASCDGACPSHATSEPGSTIAQQCECIPGYGSDGGSCSICAAATYKGATGSVDCTSCGDGKISSVTGATSVEACRCAPGHTPATAGVSGICTACNSGTFKAELGEAACAICLPGKWSADAASTCIDCGVGMFTASQGSTSIGACVALPMMQSLAPVAAPHSAAIGVTIAVNSMSAALLASSVTFVCLFGVHKVSAIAHPTPPKIVCSGGTLESGAVSLVRVTVDITVQSVTRQLPSSLSLGLPFTFYFQPLLVTIAPSGVLFDSTADIVLTSSRVFERTDVTCCFSGGSAGGNGNGGCNGLGWVVTQGTVSTDSMSVQCTAPSQRFEFPFQLVSVEVSLNGIDFTTSGLSLIYFRAPVLDTVRPLQPTHSPLFRQDSSPASVTIVGTGFLPALSSSARCKFVAAGVDAATVASVPATTTSFSGPTQWLACGLTPSASGVLNILLSLDGHNYFDIGLNLTIVASSQAIVITIDGTLTSFNLATFRDELNSLAHSVTGVTSSNLGFELSQDSSLARRDEYGEAKPVHAHDVHAMDVEDDSEEVMRATTVQVTVTAHDSPQMQATTVVGNLTLNLTNLFNANGGSFANGLFTIRQLTVLPQSGTVVRLVPSVGSLLAGTIVDVDSPGLVVTAAAMCRFGNIEVPHEGSLANVGGSGLRCRAPMQGQGLSGSYVVEVSNNGIEFSVSYPLKVFVYCGVGHRVDIVTEDCVACPPGTYNDKPIAETSCTPCEAGTAGSQSKSESSAACVACPAGTFSDAGSDRCTRCPMGEISLPSAARCTNCTGHPLEKANAASKCECIPGTYRDDVTCLPCDRSGFQPDYDRASCIACPDPTMDSGLTSKTHVGDCLCPAGTWTAAVLTSMRASDGEISYELVDSYDDDAISVSGTISLGDDRGTANTICIPCIRPDNCLGGANGRIGMSSCLPPSTGVLCGICGDAASEQRHYTRVDGSCVECGALYLQIGLVGAVVLVVVVAIVLFRQSSHVATGVILARMLPLGVIKSFVSYTQIEGSRGTSYNEVAMPGISAQWFSWMDFTQFDMSGLATCLFDIKTSIYDRVAGIVVLLLIVVVAMGVGWFFVPKKRTALQGLALTILLFLHQPVSSTMLMLFNCQPVFGFSRPWLRADLSKQCYTSEWVTTAVFGIIVLVLYTLCFPFGLAWLLRSRQRTKALLGRELLALYRKQEDQARRGLGVASGVSIPAHNVAVSTMEVQSIRSYLTAAVKWNELASIHGSYRESSYWFDIFEMMRKLLLTSFMAAVSSVVRGFDVVASVLVLTCTLYIVMLAKPNKQYEVNLLFTMTIVSEYVTAFTMLLLASSGGTGVDGAQGSNSNNFRSRVGIVSEGAVAVVLIGFNILTILAHMFVIVVLGRNGYHFLAMASSEKRNQVAVARCLHARPRLQNPSLIRTVNDVASVYHVCLMVKYAGKWRRFAGIKRHAMKPVATSFGYGQERPRVQQHTRDYNYTDNWRDGGGGVDDRNYDEMPYGSRGQRSSKPLRRSPPLPVVTSSNRSYTRPRQPSPLARRDADSDHVHDLTGRDRRAIVQTKTTTRTTTNGGRRDSGRRSPPRPWTSTPLNASTGSHIGRDIDVSTSPRVPIHFATAGAPVSADEAIALSLFPPFFPKNPASPPPMYTQSSSLHRIRTGNSTSPSPPPMHLGVVSQATLPPPPPSWEH